MNIYLSISTIHRFFIKNKYSYKKGSRHALESDPIQVYSYLSLLKKIITNKNQLIFGDESHRNDKTSNGRYGRGPKLK